MSEEIPETDGARRLEITEADLEPAPSQGPPSQSPPPRSPAPPTIPASQASPSARPGFSSAPSVSSPAPSARPFAPRVEGGGGQDWTEATRLMCTAAYMEPTFAQDVVDEIVNERHRAIQIPTGVDIATVAKHCLAACRQKIVRDGLLTLDLFLAIILFFAKHSAVWLFFGFLLGWAIVLWDMWRATYLVVVGRLNPRDFATHQAPMPADPKLARRIEELARDQRGNLTVYSGFMPFSGAGLNVGGWSFLIDLRKGRDDIFGERSTPRELTVSELYAGAARSLAALDMTNLEIRDRLFVSGSDVRDDLDLMPNPLGPPLAWVELDVLSQYLASPTHQIRHYRCIEIVDWRGELVVSLFLRFAIRNGRLFCELNKFVLVPLKEELHRLDHLGGGIRLRDVLLMISRAAAATPVLSFRAPKVMLKPVNRALEASNATRQVAGDPFFDHGATITALDRVRSTKYRRYFQLLDKEMYDKVLERTVLDSIVEVLEQHGIDTAEFAERSATIINNGIMAKETNINAHNLAVGRGPKIFSNIPRPGGGSGDGSSPPLAAQR